MNELIDKALLENDENGYFKNPKEILNLSEQEFAKIFNDMTSEEKFYMIKGWFKKQYVIDTATVYYSENLKKNGNIYFLRDEDTGYIKIGCTKNLKNRVQSIKNHLNGYGHKLNCKLLKSIKIAPEFMFEEEKELHEYFSDKRKYGEWFDISIDDLKDYYALYDESLIDEYPTDLFNVYAYTIHKLNGLTNPFLTSIDFCTNRAIQELNRIIKWAQNSKLSISTYFDGSRISFQWAN